MDDMTEFRISIVLEDGHVEVFTDDDRLFHLPSDELEAILAEIEDLVWSEHDYNQEADGAEDDG
jgi:hypothetical protein